MAEEKGNGNKSLAEMAEEKVFNGVTVTLGELQRQDGMITEAIDKMNTRNAGGIQSVVNANDDKDYRQILKHANWKNSEEADKASLALAVCDITGATKAKKFILDRITARSAGIDGWLMHESFEALTHTTFTTNSGNIKQKNDGNKSNSPLSG